MKKIYVVLIGIFVFALMVLVAIYFPLPLPTNSDFSAIYNTDLALVNRVPIYDLVAVRALTQPLSGIPDEYFFLARFPYPPWYALSTFYLGLLSPASAATLWFELNLVMLLLSVWFLTDGWNGGIRLAMFPLAMLFLPVLGALIVGQYDFPVLLGISLLLYGLKKEMTLAVVLGGLFVTFKPHIGALIFLFLLIWLIVRRNEFEKQVLKYLAISIFGLVIVGFLADSNWISGYLNMLLSYQNEGNVTSCSECISLPMLISRWFFDGSLKTAVIASGLVLISLAIFYYFNHSSLFKSPTIFITTGLITTLLVSPYFYNYDFILLLIPFAVLLEGKQSLILKIILGFCYIVPFFALGIYRRDGNVSLIMITFVIAFLFSLKVRSIDVQAHPA